MFNFQVQLQANLCKCNLSISPNQSFELFSKHSDALKLIFFSKKTVIFVISDLFDYKT